MLTVPWILKRLSALYGNGHKSPPLDYPEPHESNPHPSIIFKIHFNVEKSYLLG
jgi:hypothetical protein